MHELPLRYVIYLLLVTVLPAACTLAPPITNHASLVAPGGVSSGSTSRVPPAAIAPLRPSVQSEHLIPSIAPLASGDLLSASEVKRPPAAPSETRSWLQTHTATPLLIEPSADSSRYGELPAGSYVKVLDRTSQWLFVMFGGDADGRAPGPAWVRVSDVSEPTTAPQWAKNHQTTQLWRSSTESQGGAWLPQWAWLELLRDERNGRLLVRTPGDGRFTPPAEGWVAAGDLSPVQTPLPTEVPRAYPMTVGTDVLRLRVPYRTQLDGTLWAEANCGPTSLAMVLEGRGIDVSSGKVRKQVLEAQGIWGHDTGVFMEALAEVATQYGLRVFGLRERGGSLRSWSVEEVRSQVQLGRPVILQVAYRALPGRERALYGGDHFIVISGLVGEDFLYHDPINSDGIGYDRLMTSVQLQRAMNATDQRYSHAGFALG